MTAIVFMVGLVPSIASAAEAAPSNAKLLFRPVLCYAPIYSGTTSASASTAPVPSACPPPYMSVTANLSGSVQAGNLALGVPSYPALAVYPSTPAKLDAGVDLDKSVILPGLGLKSRYRYVLGPAGLTGHAIKSAAVQSQPSGLRTITFRLTASGAIAWNSMASRYFHEVIAVDLDGLVLSAPLVEPNQAAFTSFGDSVQVSIYAGSLTRFEVRGLASAIGKPADKRK